MTSKEAFENIIFSRRDTENMPVKSYVSDTYRNDIDKVMIDLEALEIIKNREINIEELKKAFKLTEDFDIKEIQWYLNLHFNLTVKEFLLLEKALYEE